MATPFYIKRNDSKYMNATLKDTTGSVVDLTGATVVFNAKDLNGVAVVARGSASIVSAAAGTVRYLFTTAQTADAKNLQGEFEVTFSDGTIETFPNPEYIPIVITGDLG